MTTGFDLIGDIHGCAHELERLLTLLGYVNERTNDCPLYRHPLRQVIFLGDYIDRGPDVFRVLRIVRSMVEDKRAFALMGNHEYNAILYHTPDSQGGFLRSHSESHTKPHRETLDQIKKSNENWNTWLEWFKTLPLWLKLKDAQGHQLHAVHACFNEQLMNKLAKFKKDDISLVSTTPTASFFTEKGFTETSKKGTVPFALTEEILKGTELNIPGKFIDKDGAVRKSIRVRWWEKNDTYGKMALMDKNSFADSPWESLPFTDINYVPVHLTVPTFVGHYWLNPDDMKPLSPYLACLDSSCVHSGVLTAYRYNTGDTTILPERFIQATSATI